MDANPAEVAVTRDLTDWYPTLAPGGWRLIGLALVDPFDPAREPPCRFRPGDTVRFEASEEPVR